MPGGRRGGGPKHCRQFSCPDCEPAHPHFDMKRWHKVVPDDNPYSTCNTCHQRYEACEIGQEFGVGVCKFVCKCTCEDPEDVDDEGLDLREDVYKYTVICRMIDMAECYRCAEMNSPCEFRPLRRINKKTNNKHSCSRCDNGKKNCPNLAFRH